MSAASSLNQIHPTSKPHSESDDEIDDNYAEGSCVQINRRLVPKDDSGSESDDETAEVFGSPMTEEFNMNDSDDDKTEGEEGGVRSSQEEEKGGNATLLTPDVLKKKKGKKKLHHTLDKNNYTKKRDKLKEKVIKEVLNKVLPDIGTFDVSGAIAG